MKRRYYMVIINNLQFGEKVTDAREIVRLLFENKIWLFSPFTPKVNSLRACDRLLVYAAGKGNRCFLGESTLVEPPKALHTVPKQLKNLATIYSLGSGITDEILWPDVKPIMDLLPKLSFVKDKKNYGLYLRQGLRELSEEDYIVIKG